MRKYAVRGRSFRLARFQSQLLVALVCLNLVSCGWWSILFPDKETRWELFLSSQCMVSGSAQCSAIGSGDCCYDQLATVVRENGKRVEGLAPVGLCCWRCKNGGNCCNRFYPDAYPGKLVGREESKYCENVTSLTTGLSLNNSPYSDFARYVASYVEVPPDRIVLFGSTSNPGSGEAITFGQMWCAPDGKYYVRVYVNSHNGKPRQELFNTIAHEIKHAQQFYRRGSCEFAESERPALEAEAEAFGDMIAPPCDR